MENKVAANKDEDDDRYVNLPELLEREFLMACLSSYFNARKEEQDTKEPRFYKQYTEWKQKSINPSAKSIYNTIRKLTPIIKRDKNIIFTITKGYGVFYRIKVSYLLHLHKTTMKDNIQVQELMQTLEIPEETKPDSMDVKEIHVSDDSVKDKEGLLDIDAASLEEVVEDLNNKLDRETQLLQTEMDKPYITQSSMEDMDIDRIIQSVLAKEIPKITSTIRKDLEDTYKCRIRSLEDKITLMETKVNNHHTEMETSLEKSRKISDTFRHRTHHCMEKLKEVSKAVEDATSDIPDTLEALVELKAEDIMDKLNDATESAERDIAATMITFHKTVKSNATNQNDGHVEKKIISDTDKAIRQLDDKVSKKLLEMGKDNEEKLRNLKARIDDIHSNMQSQHTSQSYAKQEKWTYSQEDTPSQQHSNKYRTDTPIQNPYKRGSDNSKQGYAVRSNTTDNRNQHNINIPMVNTEYLRKNVKHTCSDRSQVLDFYMKLRTTIKAGGIHLKQIEEINLDDTIMEESPGAPDYVTQSNTLYTILANEDIIPSDFVEAQNKIMSRNNTQDGFAGMKAILTTIHPSLTRKAPPNTPPTYSTYGDISLYENAVRNYSLMQYLYSGYSHTELQKTQQFLRGLDDDAFASAIQRVVNQIDNVRNFGGDVPEQYTINAISGTIQNMNEYGQKFTPTINVMQRLNRDNNTRKSQTNSATPDKPTRRKLVNAQCGGCKAFGHKMIDCNIIGRVLAVMELTKTHPTLCKKILTNHINKNDPAKRMAIVRSLQQCDITSTCTSAEECILDEAINDTIDCTINAADCTVTGTGDILEREE